MKFIKRTLLMSGIAACFALLANSQQAQAPDPNPSKSPDVFLDNHRKLIPKKDKPATSRTVSGQVIDDSGQPLEGALVRLTDTKTKEKLSYFTKKDGRYTFEDLSFSVDYHVQAHWKNLDSDERNISQYDHAPKVGRTLTVVTPEGVAPAQTAGAVKETAKPKP
jgi:Carboxypeptidase regulatory-like domain